MGSVIILHGSWRHEPNSEAGARQQNGCIANKLRCLLQSIDLFVQKGKRVLKKLAMARILCHFQLLKDMPTPEFKVIPLACARYLRRIARRLFR